VAAAVLFKEEEMKQRKTLGIAAMAAISLMAFLGAGSASATALCTDAGCSVTYPEGTTVDASLSGTAILESGSTTLDTCTGGTAKGKTGTPSETKVPVSIETLTWTGCTNTTDTITKGSFEFEKATGDSAKVIGKGSEVTVNTLGVTCTYVTGTGTQLGTVTGGSEPVLNISATVAKIAGSVICPATASWTATYIFTEPHALHFGA
jgi:hypothetical protein